MKALPWRDGDIDLDALGLTKEQFVEKYRMPEVDLVDLLERFFASKQA